MPGPDRRQPVGPRPVLLPPGPVADLLTRRMSAGPAALRTLRVLRGPTAPSPAALARGRHRVDAFLAAERTARRAAANPALRSRMDRWELRRATLSGRLRTVVAGRRQRTPEQVLADLLTLARRRPAPSRGRASVIVRSPVAGATTGDLLGSGAAVRALTGLGLRVRPLRRDAAGSHSYKVVLPVLARDLGNEIANVAWALARLGSVTSARPDRRTLRLFAGGVSSATVAPPQIAWHLGMVRADRAHELPSGHALGAPGGAGAVIAHPDTGWAPHPQYDQARIDTVRSYGTASDSAGPTSARHTVVKRLLNGPNLTHGTATGCLMVGGDGSRPDVTSLTDSERAMKRSG